MLNFFYTLFNALFTGHWDNRLDVFTDLKLTFQQVVTWIGSIFSDNTMNFEPTFEEGINLLSGVLAVVVVVGLSFFVIKTIKRIFTIFFQGVR